MLSLRHVDRPAAARTTTDKTAATLQFAEDAHRTTTMLPSFVASLGEFLHVGSESGTDTLDSEADTDIELTPTGTDLRKIEELSALEIVPDDEDLVENSPA